MDQLDFGDNIRIIELLMRLDAKLDRVLNLLEDEDDEGDELDP